MILAKHRVMLKSDAQSSKSLMCGSFNESAGILAVPPFLAAFGFAGAPPPPDTLRFVITWHEAWLVNGKHIQYY